MTDNQSYIQIGRRRLQRIIPYPQPVRDGTTRCIRCGQIDEEVWHDENVCLAAVQP